MSSKISRRIADLLVWVGFVMIIIGCALAYPFVRDTLQAQSDPSVSLSFVVTLPPAPPPPAVTPVPPRPPLTEPVMVLVTSTQTPTLPPTALPSSAPASVTPAMPAPTVTSSAVPAPVVLPDNNAAQDSVMTTPATAQPAPIITGIPPVRIVIPAIGLDAPVQTVGWHLDKGTSVWDVPDRRAAGWLKTSAPAGQSGNTVLDGHHNIKGEVFKQLIDLKPGDRIDLYAGSAIYRYATTEKHILPDRDQPMAVRIGNAKWIQPTDDERLTLVTCWPYTNNTHRLIIVARPLPTPQPDRQKGSVE